MSEETGGVRIDLKTLIAAGSLAVSVFVLVNQYSSDATAHEATAHEAEQDKRLCRIEARLGTGECKQ